MFFGHGYYNPLLHVATTRRTVVTIVKDVATVTITVQNFRKKKPVSTKLDTGKSLLTIFLVL